MFLGVVLFQVVMPQHSCHKALEYSLGAQISLGTLNSPWIGAMLSLEVGISHPKRQLLNTYFVSAIARSIVQTTHFQGPANL